ncbi:MAG TPA: endonuclease domain-containing protein [Anaerolineaceae bacterium]
MDKNEPNPNRRLRGKLLTVAREMRHQPTPAEDLLWHSLRDYQIAGYKFRRQHPIDRFVVDFYCSEARLVIEVDGAVHRQQIEADMQRAQILTGLGCRVVRFTNIQVLESLDSVLCQIQAILTGTPSLKSGFDDFGEGVGG